MWGDRLRYGHISSNSLSNTASLSLSLIIIVKGLHYCPFLFIHCYSNGQHHHHRCQWAVLIYRLLETFIILHKYIYTLLSKHENFIVIIHPSSSSTSYPRGPKTQRYVPIDIVRYKWHLDISNCVLTFICPYVPIR